MISYFRYVFFGTPEFAAIILEKLVAAGMPPVLVVCNPDRPVGRKKTITPPPTKVVAQNHSIPVWQPETLEIRNWKLEIEKLGGIDFALIAAYARIIPRDIIDALPAKFLCVHPSLLPKYRGATPIQSVILAGEKTTGTTLFLIDERVDHGPILAQRELALSTLNIGSSQDRRSCEDQKLGRSNLPTYESLMRRLAELSADLLIETLPKFAKGEIKSRLQNESEATCTKKFSAEDGYVNPVILSEAKNLGGEAAIKIDRKIRALNPEPGVFTLSPSKGGHKRVKLLESELKDGRLVLKKIQIEGKKPTPIYGSPTSID